MSKLEKIPEFNKKDWKLIGDEICDRIRVQTQVEGKDVFNKRFRVYKAGYNKIKKKRGGDTGKVDLTLTGDMMNGLQTRGFTNNSVVIGWSGLNSKKIKGNRKQGRAVTTKNKPIPDKVTKWVRSYLGTRVDMNIQKNTSKPIVYTIGKR